MIFLAVAKVSYYGDVLVDLTQDTVTDASHIAAGKIGHLQNGERVVGTASGGGDAGMNVQCYHGMASAKTTSYSATGVKLTVAKTGTYKVSWMGCRNTNSGTNGSQLYIGSSAYGSAQTTFSNTYGQSVVLNNVSLTAGQTIEVRARARSTSYVMMVGNLCIEQIS